MVAYQKILQLSYVDKFLSDVHLEFRDKYKNELSGRSIINIQFDFGGDYQRILIDAEEWAKLQAKMPKMMRSFDQSDKSKKTVASMIDRPGERPLKKSVKIIETKKEEIMEDDNEGDNDVYAANRKRLAEKMNPKKKKPEMK